MKRGLASPWVHSALAITRRLRLQLLLDRQSFGDVHGSSAGELVLGGQLIDLVLLAQMFHELEQLAGELALLVAGVVPEPFQIR